MAQTIELNGKIYDVLTGLPIKKSQQKTQADSRRSSVGVIDGVRRPKGAKPLTAAHSAKPKTSKKPAAKLKHDSSKSAQRIHNRQQRAKVLLRKAVKPPVASKAAQEKVAPRPKLVNHSAVLSRAKTVPKSEHISRFGQRKVVAPSAVSSNTTAHKVSAPSKKPIDKMVVKETPKKTHKKKKNNKPIGWLIVGLLIFAAVGYAVYVNLPNINMKIASMRAGFSANLPSYTPAGYRLKGPDGYSDGQISFTYSSKSTNKYYRITEKKSEWDSESLLSNVVSQNANYSTDRHQGLTIYLYDDHTATWVNSGVWYTIDGNAELSTQQIEKIAASL